MRLFKSNKCTSISDVFDTDDNFEDVVFHHKRKPPAKIKLNKKIVKLERFLDMTLSLVRILGRDYFQ